MLSRTADHLYWMARYIERAENMARVLDVTYNMSLVPNAAQSEAALWQPAVEIAGNTELFEKNYGEYTAANVIQYMSMDDANPSSIYNSLRSARENARAVRVAMSSETWENINTLWLEFSQFIGIRLVESGLSVFCDWVKSRSHLFRGVSFGTMLRDDAFRFVRLGTFIERADNTARLLDVKYHLLLPEGEEVGGAVDYYEWSAVLHSVSAFQAYQKVFSDTIVPWRVAELLVLRGDMPRSLLACYDEITIILGQLSGRQNNECRRLAGELHAKLRYARMRDIFQDGLHEFLEDFIVSNNKLGGEIQRTYLNVHGG
ncbi:MAG TPA: alpha-E domain-containing protein [Methylovorus sp.]|uniref:alpha-E domain-containing protein n=1 Tax=Methylovorus menthalis TaxID=1002227 RepID=UPI001E50D49E|nr:alpha-E domain-containing protein [Methylovorus menthalis]MCB4810340.1 alpha-E domain-containing protein [Methylovorus menthalis]HWU33772.1 alpha-E domain-containing protein [Methylovorus sp.]